MASSFVFDIHLVETWKYFDMETDMLITSCKHVYKTHITYTLS